MTIVDCPRCINGTEPGSFGTEPCSSCHGTQVVRKPTIRVRRPTYYALMLEAPHEDAKLYGLYETEARAWDASTDPELRDLVKYGCEAKVYPVELNARPREATNR